MCTIGTNADSTLPTQRGTQPGNGSLLQVITYATGVEPVVAGVLGFVLLSQTLENSGQLFGLNPMATVVEGFRWALLGSQSAPGPTLWISVAVSVILLVSGLFYFRRMERTFADEI